MLRGDPPAQAGGLHDRLQEADLLADRVHQQRAVRAEGRGERQAGEPAARAEVQQAVDAERRERRHGGQGVQDVEAGDVRRLADGRQVDGLGPGEEEAHVGVDRGAGGRLQDQAERHEAGVERLVVRRGERRKVLETRRERTSRPVQGTLHVVVH